MRHWMAWYAQAIGLCRSEANFNQWPYSYDSCDIGTVPNQTINGLPAAATVGGDQSEGGVLSYLPGQRLSRCTCPGESHPGPKHSDGTFVGRSVPEIDVFEAQVRITRFEFPFWILTLL